MNPCQLSDINYYEEPAKLPQEQLQWIQCIPKAETHLHIEGSLDWDLLKSAHPQKYAEPPVSWQPEFRFRSFAEFEGELLGYAADWFTSAQRYHDCAKQTFRRLQAQNVKYVETSFASGVIEFFGVPGREIVPAIREAVPEGLEVRLFIGIHHSGYNDKMRELLDEALTWEQLDGIDLHGPEDDPTLDWAPDYYRRARDAGKFCKAHAGEFCGADMVRYVIDELKVTRIEHGMRAIEDPDLLTRLATEGQVLDVCPISNLKLVGYDHLHAHPLRKLMDAGVRCTISTDDPISFGNSLTGEYIHILRSGLFTPEDLIKLIRTAFEVALVDPSTREQWVSELENITI